jgi:hypothetical protein
VVLASSWRQRGRQDACGVASDPYRRSRRRSSARPSLPATPQQIARPEIDQAKAAGAPPKPAPPPKPRRPRSRPRKDPLDHARTVYARSPGPTLPELCAKDRVGTNTAKKAMKGNGVDPKPPARSLSAAAAAQNPEAKARALSKPPLSADCCPARTLTQRRRRPLVVSRGSARPQRPRPRRHPMEQRQGHDRALCPTRTSGRSGRTGPAARRPPKFEHTGPGARA